MHRHSGDVERFDRWAATYDRHWMQRFLFTPVQRIVLELASDQVPKPTAILDVGCGTGRLLRAAHELFPSARLDGVDAAEGMIREARAGASGIAVDFKVATAEELPAADSTYDLVFSTLTFHHWADQARGIAEVRRVLAPGGRWILADFIAGGIAALVAPSRMPERRRLDTMLGASQLHVVAKRTVWRTMGNISVLAIGS